jgi:hypothetical protein
VPRVLPSSTISPRKIPRIEPCDVWRNAVRHDRANDAECHFSGHVESAGKPEHFDATTRAGLGDMPLCRYLFAQVSARVRVQEVAGDLVLVSRRCARSHGGVSPQGAHIPPYWDAVCGAIKAPHSMHLIRSMPIAVSCRRRNLFGPVAIMIDPPGYQRWYTRSPTRGTLMEQPHFLDVAVEGNC